MKAWIRLPGAPVATGIWGDGYSSIVWDARYSLTSNSKLGRTVGDADTIDAGEGNDIVDGGAGNDGINAGEGDNEVYGGLGDDTILQAQKRRIWGGASDDVPRR